MTPEQTLSDAIASVIRARVAQRRLPQSYFMERFGWSQGKVSRKLNGQTPLTLDEVDAIAGDLGLDAVTLVTLAKQAQAEGARFRPAE